MHGSDDRESWVDTGKGRNLSVPDSYRSDVNPSENARKPKENEGKYINSKLNFNRCIYWGGILIIFTFSIMGSFFMDIKGEGPFVIFVSGNLIAIFIYFVGKKYVKPEFDADKPVRSLSGRPRFPSGAFSFYSGFVTSLIVDGIRFRVPHHWAFHLLPYDLGEREVEVEIYETKGESYALSIDGFSIQKEAENGLFDVLMDLRRLFAAFGGVVSGVYAFHIIGELGVSMHLGLEDPAFYSLPETWSGVFLQPSSLMMGGLTALIGPPALWYYIRHRKALSNIKEMYRKEGVIE